MEGGKDTHYCPDLGIVACGIHSVLHWDSGRRQKEKKDVLVTLSWLLLLLLLLLLCWLVIPLLCSKQTLSELSELVLVVSL